MISGRLAATAYHEAGHLVCAWKFGFRIRNASIVADDSTHGRVEHDSPLRGVRLDVDRSQKAIIKAEQAIKICLAGPIAQKRFRRSSLRSWHAEADFDLATDLALRLQGSGELATAYLRWLNVATTALIEANWRHVGRIADDLLEHKKLSADQVQAALTSSLKANISETPDGTIRLTRAT